MYIELHAASAFSFLQGASLPETLVERAAALGYPALALLDADGVYGAPRFHKAAQRAGLKAIIGAEITIGIGDRGSGIGGVPGVPGVTGSGPRDLRSRRIPDPGSPIPSTWSLPVLAETQEGYRNLCRLITRMKMRTDQSGPASPRTTRSVRWSGKRDGALTLEELDGATAGL